MEQKVMFQPHINRLNSSWYHSGQKRVNSNIKTQKSNQPLSAVGVEVVWPVRDVVDVAARL